MHSRTEIINYIIKKYNLKSYCELGTQVRSINFDKIECEDKFCVDIDPNAKADFTGSTDNFFKQLNRVYDCYFIDASHVYEDVQRDFENALKVLSPNGWIVLHDCCPEKEEHTIVPRPTERGHWNGDVYKFACKLSVNKNYWTVNEDNGCGVYRNDGNYKIHNKENWSWSEFQQNKKTLLNLITYEQFLSL